MFVLFVGVLLISFFLPTASLLAISWALLAFGGMTIVPIEWTGGVSLLVGNVAALCVVIKTCLEKDGAAGLIRAAVDIRRLGLLALFTAIAVIGAVLLPRLFAGDVLVYAMQTAFKGLSLLTPTSANLTQSFYLVLSFFTAAAYAALARSPQFVDDIGRAFIVGASCLVFTGLLDMAAGSVGASSMLDVFRTAGYTYLIDVEMAGVRRTVGLMPEASSFGSFAVFWTGLLLFARRIYSPRTRALVVFPLIGACAAMAVLSTSSTAFAGLAVLALTHLADMLGRLVDRRADDRIQVAREIVIQLGVAVVILIVLMAVDGTRETLFKLVDEVVLQKSQSSSYEERSAWTSQAVEALGATHGLGVGVGSLRTSNYFVNVLATTGWLGFGPFSAFLALVFLSRPTRIGDPRIRELARGAKLVLVPSFAMATLSATTPDYGVATGALFGIIVEITSIRWLLGYRPAGQRA
jgi:hypothetical protein